MGQRLWSSSGWRRTGSQWRRAGAGAALPAQSTAAAHKSLGQWQLDGGVLELELKLHEGGKTIGARLENLGASLPKGFKLPLL